METQEEKLQTLLGSGSPLTYHIVRSYLSAIGYKKPGKGLKQIINAILTYPDCTEIIFDLEKMYNMKNSATKKRVKPDDDDVTDNQVITGEVVEDAVVGDDEDDERKKQETRLNERLIMLKKTCSGSNERKVKRLLDALDEKDFIENNERKDPANFSDI